MKAPELPFNRIILKTLKGDRRLSVSEFERVPLTERVRALLEKRLEFYQDHLRVEANDALRALRERG